MTHIFCHMCLSKAYLDQSLLKENLYDWSATVSKKTMTHNFVACLCQKQIWNSHLNILGQWRWFVRFFICELCSIDRKPLSILCTFYIIDINILKKSWIIIHKSLVSINYNAANTYALYNACMCNMHARDQIYPLRFCLNKNSSK